MMKKGDKILTLYLDELTIDLMNDLLNVWENKMVKWLENENQFPINWTSKDVNSLEIKKKIKQ